MGNNAGQMATGMSQVYDRYVVDRGLYLLQDAARAAGLGLWRDPQAAASWEWREGVAGRCSAMQH